MEFEDYIEELRESYLVGKLVADFIFPDTYDYLLTRGLVPPPDSVEWISFREQALKYNMQYLYHHGKRLADCRGEELYDVDREMIQVRNQRRIVNMTKKFLVYDFIRSGKLMLTNKQQDNESTSE